MAIHYNGKIGTLYKGDYKPCRWYDYSKLAAGWKRDTKTGTLIAFDGTYNDNVESLTVKGKSTQVQSVWGTNLVSNGDFSNGTTGYTGFSVSLAVSSKILSATTTATTTTPYVIYSFGSLFTAAHKIYVKLKYRYTAGNPTDIRFSLRGSTGGTTVAVHIDSMPVINQWYVSSGVATVPGDWSGVTQLRVYLVGSGAIGDVLQIDGVSGIEVIDLTAEFGAGKEPTAAQMDAMLSQYPNSWFSGKAQLTTDVITYTANSPGPNYPSPITGAQPGKVMVNSVDYPLSLPSPFYSLPDGTQDIVELISGAGTRNIGVKVFDGTENWTYNGNSNGITNCYTAVDYNAAVSPALCTHFVYNYSSPSGGTFRTVIVAPFVRIQLFIPNAILTNPQNNNIATKAWLAAQYAAGTPVTALCKLSASQPITLTPMTIPTIPRHTEISADGAEITTTIKVVDTTL